jgi:glyoxylase-like metal-dependent hydrolase (beta-lactamase superfamily II)/ferredoxin
MADPRRRARENVDGAWFVDTTCIACDACRQCAPQIFAEHADGTSSVMRQPQGGDDVDDAARALLACPVGAIGGAPAKERLVSLFPHELDDGLWYCGYNSPKSYGGNAYLVDVNGTLAMIDAPRFVAPLVSFIEARGGLAGIFLTHGDDVGDSDRYAERFGCPVTIHASDAHAAPFAHDVVTAAAGDDTTTRCGGALAIVPVPGHTRGSVLFFVGDRCFTGDSLAWSREDERLMAFRDACWFSWSEQKRSLARVAESGRAFTWVLPGHGQRHRQSAAENASALRALVSTM